MPKTWVLICDASRARLFEAGAKGKAWTVLEELSHERSRAMGRDLMADRPGRVQESSPQAGGRRSAMEPSTDPREVEAQHFAHELSDLLLKGLEQKDYTELVLAAAPHFLGLLRGTISERVARSIKVALDKDYSRMPIEEVQALIEEHM